MSSPTAIPAPATPSLARADSTMLASEATISTHASATATGGAGAQAILIS
jgi:hypothetical protein